MADDYELPPEEAYPNELPDTPDEGNGVDVGTSETTNEEQAQSESPVSESEPAALGEPERLRPPRAQDFRRRMRHQVSMLPLALFLLGLGGYLTARQQHIEGRPDFTAPSLLGLVVLALAFAAVFRAIVFGRRERGLLFIGLWIWTTAGAAALLVYAYDAQPDVTEWWPLVLASLSFTFLLTYVFERSHDARLVLLALLTAVAAGTAFWITMGNVDQSFLNTAADYWPLLLLVIGIGLLPLAFRRRTG